jgi:ABC-type uncharacterized transport system permease subunit
VLFEGLTPRILLHVVGVSSLAFAVLVSFWRRALASYSSASS